MAHLHLDYFFMCQVQSVIFLSKFLDLLREKQKLLVVCFLIEEIKYAGNKSRVLRLSYGY